MNRYEIEMPNGENRITNSKREYTHAVIVREVEHGVDKGWGLISQNGSEVLAWKSLEQVASRWGVRNPNSVYFGSEFRVVEIKVIA